MADNPTGIPSEGFAQFLWLVGAGNVGVILATIIGAVLQRRKAKAEAAAPAATALTSERFSGGPTDWMALQLHQIEQNTDATFKLMKKLHDVCARDRADRLREKRKRTRKK